MFGNGPFEDESEEENNPIDEANVEDPLINNPHSDGSNEFGRLPWEDLSTSEADELREQTDSPMCEHDDSREVITKASGGGAQVAGTGISGSQEVTKIVCPVCGGEWDTSNNVKQDSDDRMFGI